MASENTSQEDDAANESDSMTTAAVVALMLTNLCGQSAAKYAPHVIRAAEKYNHDPRVLVSMMKQESGCDPKATGALGELGQMQLKKFTWATKGYDHLSDARLRRPSINIRLGARHLHNCLLKCNGSLAGALGLYKGFRRRKDGSCKEDSSYSREILARVVGVPVS